MRKIALMFIIFVLMIVFAQPAFAYKYSYNRKTSKGYWRDNSNDGNFYNNANYIGLNGYRPKSRGGSSNKSDGYFF